MLRMLVLGWLLGVVTLSAGALVAANWYEYHVYVRGDPNPIEMVNQHGWELVFVTDDPRLFMYRRPRLRLP